MARRWNTCKLDQAVKNEIAVNSQNIYFLYRNHHTCERISLKSLLSFCIYSKLRLATATATNNRVVYDVNGNKARATLAHSLDRTSLQKISARACGPQVIPELQIFIIDTKYLLFQPKMMMTFHSSLLSARGGYLGHFLFAARN